MVAISTGGFGSLRIRCLGELRIHRAQSALTLPISGKTREVLAYLLFNANKAIRRTSLSSLIWTDRDERRSRANLNTALWRINRALKTADIKEIDLKVSGDALTLSLDQAVFIDIRVLEASVRDALAAFAGVDKACLSSGLRAALLDIFVPECEGFLQDLDSEWVLVERERLFNLQIRGLTLIMRDFAESGRFEEALEQGQRVLRMDPLHESVRRQVMWLHVLCGHQGNAIRQYRECARVLKDELGVSPMPETRALYEYILARSSAVKAAVVERRGGGLSGADFGEMDAAAKPIGFDEDLARLRSLLSHLNSRKQSVFSALAEIGAT